MMIPMIKKMIFFIAFRPFTSTQIREVPLEAKYMCKGYFRFPAFCQFYRKVRFCIFHSSGSLQISRSFFRSMQFQSLQFQLITRIIYLSKKKILMRPMNRNTFFPENYTKRIRTVQAVRILFSIFAFRIFREPTFFYSFFLRKQLVNTPKTACRENGNDTAPKIRFQK